jgi:folylpolyglutamate synthase
LDSYYNILFSIVLFWRVHHIWPKHLTLVSHAFKRSRLVDAHCVAIAFPLDRVRFVGINPPGIGSPEPSSKGPDGGVTIDGQVSSEKAEAMRGVSEVVDHWAEDPHGAGEVLAGKRRQRNRWKVDQRLFLNDEERSRSKVRTKLLHDGGEVLLEGGIMPWADNIVLSR